MRTFFPQVKVCVSFYRGRQLEEKEQLQSLYSFCKPLAHFAWAFLAVMFVKNVFETFKATKSKSKFYVSYTREEKTCLQIVGLITT